MISFFSLSPLVHDLFRLWALLLCFSSVICIIYAAKQKQYHYLLAALPCFLLTYILRQLMLTIVPPYQENNSFTALLHWEIPWLYPAIILLLLSAISAFLLYRNISYGKHNITPGSIRLCGDLLPCGICYWRQGGKVIFANDTITELCFALTGNALRNGEELFTALTLPLQPIDNRMWSFTHRLFTFKGEPLHELIATDITDLYAKTALLQEEKEELIRYNKALQDYRLHIDETVKQQEILQAKIAIHDEMNRLLLTTVAAGNEGGGSIDDALKLWQRNALLLCREATGKRNNEPLTGLADIASSLKMQLILPDALPEELQQEQKLLFTAAAQEALANAFRHGQANKMEIRFTTTEKDLRCDLINDGELPESLPELTGGLGNLQRLAYMQGADISVSIEEHFTLSLFFPVAPDIDK